MLRHKLETYGQYLFRYIDCILDRVPIVGFTLFLCGILFSAPACTTHLGETEISYEADVSSDNSQLHVEEAFRRFYETYGGIESLGNPITSIMIVDGWRVQYFEMARLEYHPENDPAYRVTVGWLGDILQRRRPPLPPSSLPPSTSSHSRYFAETGHTLSGDFLDYFDAHGGSVRFGKPISEPFLLNGRLTQDLQSARFFWTPDLNPPISLENIGLTHLETIGQNNKK